MPGAPLRQASPYRWGFTVTLGAVSALLLVPAVVNVRQVLVLLLTAMFLAIGINPAVGALCARGVRRTMAVTIVFSVVVLAFVGVG